MCHECPAVEAVDNKRGDSTMDETRVAVDAVSEADDAVDVFGLLMLVHLKQFNHALSHERIM